MLNKLSNYILTPKFATKIKCLLPDIIIKYVCDISATFLRQNCDKIFQPRLCKPRINSRISLYKADKLIIAIRSPNQMSDICLSNKICPISRIIPIIIPPWSNNRQIRIYAQKGTYFAYFRDSLSISSAFMTFSSTASFIILDTIALFFFSIPKRSLKEVFVRFCF